MATVDEKGPFCQSCGLPFKKPEDFGTEANGFRSNDYCHYCYQHGTFTDPDITQAAMIDRCVEAMTRQHIMPAAQARALMTSVLPHLKRWQQPVGVAF
jgi:Putative zinc ribbon domain